MPERRQSDIYLRIIIGLLTILNTVVGAWCIAVSKTVIHNDKEISNIKIILEERDKKMNTDIQAILAAVKK